MKLFAKIVETQVEGIVCAVWIVMRKEIRGSAQFIGKADKEVTPRYNENSRQ